MMMGWRKPGRPEADSSSGCCGEVPTTPWRTSPPTHVYNHVNVSTEDARMFLVLNEPFEYYDVISYK
jgi:hypothetical protein